MEKGGDGGRTRWRKEETGVGEGGKIRVIYSQWEMGGILGLFLNTSKARLEARNVNLSGNRVWEYSYNIPSTLN